MRPLLGQGTRAISLKSRAPLSPCCKPFDLQSQKEARITSGLMGQGWERAQALKKDHSPAANPASQHGDKQTPSLSTQLWKHLFRLSTFPLTARRRRSLRPAFHVQDIALPRNKSPRPGCATGVQRRFKPLKQTSLHQQYLPISFKCISPPCSLCSEEGDCTYLFIHSQLSL